MTASEIISTKQNRICLSRTEIYLADKTAAVMLVVKYWAGGVVTFPSYVAARKLRMLLGNLHILGVLIMKNSRVGLFGMAESHWSEQNLLAIRRWLCSCVYDFKIPWDIVLSRFLGMFTTV